MARILILLLVTTAAFGAAQMEPRTLISPISGKPFTVIDIPVTSGNKRILGVEGATDMGTDDDGCRHSSGPSEYEHYVVIDPYSYFSALGVEYGQNGKFNNRLSQEFKQWVISADGFHSEWVMDKDKLHSRAQRIGKAKGEQVPPIQDWVMPQNMIPLEKKYRMALFCYRRRGATDAFLGKLALTAAWAIRARINKPLMDSRLRPGIEEVNDRIAKHVVDGEVFDVKVFHEAYTKVFESSRLTDEGYFTAGIALVGFALRVGDFAQAMQVLDDMKKRFDGDKDMHVFFRGLVRDRRTMITTDYLGFLDTSIKHMVSAIANEEFPRAKLPEIVLVVAESYRRMGDGFRAYDWYLTLADMEETDPRLRRQIRESGKVPSVDAPYPVLLGWRADEYLERLTAEGVTHTGTISGPDAKLLNAIINEGLGTLAYSNPAWKPRTGGDLRELTKIMQDVGLAVLDYTERSGEWPEGLGQLWVSGVIPDRNRYNRFHDIINGEPLVYKPVGGGLRGLPRNTVVLSTASAVSTNQGPRYGAFLADLSVVWTAEKLEPGSLHTP